MNSLSRPFTVRIPQDSLNDHLAAFQLALDLFGSAELTEFLPPRDHPRYVDILGELVRAEIGHGWQQGRPTDLETYQRRFPDLFAHPALVFQLAQEDFQQRLQAGEKASMADYCQRFNLKNGERMSALDPAVSSKFDIAPNAQLQNFPPTDVSPDQSDRSNPSGSAWPAIEVGPTRLGKPSPGMPIPSDPEIVWKLSDAMREMPKVGDDFLGFSLLAELGKGAFGKVFLAQQAELAGRFVALKVATGLFPESQTLAQLQHTHIVPIYSYHHGQPFQAVCMPYLGATTLAHILADIRTHKSMPSSGKELLSTLNGRRKSTRHFEDSSKDHHSDPAHDASPNGVVDLPAKPHGAPTAMLELEGMSYVDSILWLAVRLTSGLAHAHERGIVHRDLKPANVLLTDDGVPMLLDFNLAQNVKQRDSAAAASIGGTLPYMAPEHLEAFRGAEQTVDARSDLYSLGVILFELLTGAAPFPSYRKLPMREVVARMIDDRRNGAPTLRGLNPNIPAAVEAIVRRCLEADPARRYQTAAELHEDLQRHLEHLPLKHTTNPSWRELTQKFRRRHPRLTSATSVAMIALAIVTALGSIIAWREEEHGRLQARATLSRFQEDAQSACFLMNARSVRERLDEGQQACRTTLGHFQVLENPNWFDAPAIKRLPGDEQQRLRADIGQVLVLLAHAQQLAAEREEKAERQQEHWREGLLLCSLAESCYSSDEQPRALWKQRGDLLERLQQLDQAKQARERADRTDFKSAQDRYLTARQLAEEGKFRAALPLLREAILMKPQDFNLHFLQGICHDHLGQHADAIACYRACIALRPEFWGAYYNRGLAYLHQNDWQSAALDFDKVTQFKADFAEAYIQRAFARQGMKQLEPAIADLTEALERGSTQTRVYFMRAKLHEKVGNKERARSDFADGMGREPADELSWIARGLAHLPADPKRALSDFDHALTANPRSLAALQNKAHVLGKYFKRPQEAIGVFDKAIAYYPDDARPRAGRGLYFARLGQRDAALKDAEHALLLDTTSPNLYLVAGIYALTSQKEREDQDQAMRLLSAALKSGYGFDYLEIDRDLDPLRNLPIFRRVIDGTRALRTGSASNLRQ